MNGIEQLLSTEIVAGVTLRGLAFLLGGIVGGLVVSAVVNAFIRRVVRASPPGSVPRAVTDALYRPARWALVVAGIWVGILLLEDDMGREHALESGWFIASELPFMLWFGLRLLDNLGGVWEQRAERSQGTFDDQLVPVLRAGAKIVLIAVAVIMFIQNVGGDVGSLLAGLGIGGVAVAMASKDTLANLFGSVVIFVDRPFQIGDWVEIGGQEGTVEEVGLRVTRIRTFANSLITVPNSQLTTNAINNWSRMHKRRIKLTIGLTYDSSAEKVEQAVNAIREVLREDERISQDFFLVHFTEFGPSSLDIFVYCFTKTVRWDEYMQVRQEVLLAFMRRIQALGLSFAFPTQSLHVESLPELAPSRPS